jgi:predicted transposase YbfD/YdcC
MSSRPGVLKYFSELKDPRRRQARVLHPFENLLVIAICAVICGADSWWDIALFGDAKQKWFATFLDLDNGVPSHDTFSRVFRRLRPDAFAQCFTRWSAGLSESKIGEVIAIDGKVLRRSFDRAGNKAAIHMVQAWATDNQLVLGQLTCAEKSNEITALPQLLEMLEITDSIVTIDAMGTQKAIATQIIAQGGDYVLALKDNHPHLNADVIDLLDWAATDPSRCSTDLSHTTGHGRSEQRRVVSTGAVEDLPNRTDWKGLQSVVMVASKRIEGDKVSQDWRYYISSLPGDDAEFLGLLIREHWCIENQLHWSLDVTFREDDSRVRKGHGAENLALLRKIALNLLKQEKTRKASIRSKRKLGGWDHDYLLKLLGL